MITKTELKKQFDESVSKTLSMCEDLNTFKEKDEHIAKVFEISDWLIGKDLDIMSENDLLRGGGRLSGIYTYLGNWTSRARTERDVYEQQLSEVLNKLTTDLYGESGEKITLARARAKQEVSDLEKLVIIKESEKNNYENLMNATQSMISFFQSAIKVKQGERYLGRNIQDNQ